MKLQESLLHKYLSYDSTTGKLYLLDITLCKTKEILPDIFYYVQFTIKHNSAQYKYKLKLSNLIWYLVYKHKPLPKEKVFHKDLDLNNFKLNNLILIKSSTFFLIKEALDNLQGKLRIYPHPKDHFVYVLEYKHKGRVLKENISDIGIARTKMLKLQLNIVKFISKYVCTL